MSCESGDARGDAPADSTPRGLEDIAVDYRSVNRHLWEVGRPLRLRGLDVKEVSSFADLVAEVYALNLGEFMVFAWGWHEEPDRIDEQGRSCDVFEVHVLLLGSQHTFTLACPVDKAQEYEVLEWLRGPRALGFLRALWAPLLNSAPIHMSFPTEAAVWQHQIGVLDEIQKIVTTEIAAARGRAARAAVHTEEAAER
jgi:hypothetical protein